MEFAVARVFLKQLVQDFAGFRSEVAEESRLLLLHAVGSLAAGEHGRVEGEMAQQVEWVGVRLASLGGNKLEINPALGKLVDDVVASDGVGPKGAQFFRVAAERPDFFRGESVSLTTRSCRPSESSSWTSSATISTWPPSK